jgi:hypothetical protein
MKFGKKFVGIVVGNFIQVFRKILFFIFNFYFLHKKTKFFIIYLNIIFIFIKYSIIIDKNYYIIFVKHLAFII